MASVTKNKDYDLNKSFVDQDGNNYSSEASSNLDKILNFIKDIRKK